MATPAAGSAGLALKIPTTAGAAISVAREAEILREMHGLGLGPIEETIPRYVECRQLDGRHVLVSTAMSGVPMSVGYHRWPHTARRPAVAEDYSLALSWLTVFQEESVCGERQLRWGTEVVEAMSQRWHGHADLDEALQHVGPAAERLGLLDVVQTAVHGDFWFGNILVDEGRVSGVIDWESGAACGEPLADVARFVLSYSLYLDRHTRAGRRVLGHPGLRRSTNGAGISYGLLGSGWYPQLVRTELTRSLRRLGLPATRWYDMALVGIAEVAATGGDDTFAAEHLTLLASLPPYPRPVGT
ncbi:MAG: aminoglycoside phosphotransferase family protein [Nocardioidaceae bacterium]